MFVCVAHEHAVCVRAQRERERERECVCVRARVFYNRGYHQQKLTVPLPFLFLLARTCASSGYLVAGLFVGLEFRLLGFGFRQAFRVWF